MTSGGSGMMSKVARAGRNFATRFRLRTKRSSATSAFDAISPKVAEPGKNCLPLAASSGAQALLPNVPLNEENMLMMGFMTSTGIASGRSQLPQQHGGDDDDEASLWSGLSPPAACSSLSVSMWSSEQVECDDSEEFSVGETFAVSECPDVAPQ